MSKVPYKSCFRDAYVSPRTIKMLQITSWRVLNVPIYRQVRWDSFPGPQVKWRVAGAADSTDAACASAAVSPPPLPTTSSPTPCGAGSPRVAPWACCSSHSTCCAVGLPESPCAGKSLPGPLGPLINCFNPMICTPYPQTAIQFSGFDCDRYTFIYHTLNKSRWLRSI